MYFSYLQRRDLNMEKREKEDETDYRLCLELQSK